VRKPLAAVTLFDLQDYAESLYDLAPAFQVLLLRSVKSALRLGKPEQKLAQRILSEAQVIKLIALEPDPRNHLLLLILYKAGPRAREVCDLRRRNLQRNGESGQITIYGKGEKTRSILLSPEVWRQLEDHCGGFAPDAYVFQSRSSAGKYRANILWADSLRVRSTGS
jgi:integrase/recombinase XerD